MRLDVKRERNCDRLSKVIWTDRARRLGQGARGVVASAEAGPGIPGAGEMLELVGQAELDWNLVREMWGMTGSQFVGETAQMMTRGREGGRLDKETGD